MVLLPRILWKIREDQATALLIALNWSGEPWFSELIQMLVDQLLLLPQLPSLLFLPFQPAAHHPFWRSLNPAVWPLWEIVTKQQAFQRKLLTSQAGWRQGGCHSEAYSCTPCTPCADGLWRLGNFLPNWKNFQKHRFIWSKFSRIKAWKNLLNKPALQVRSNSICFCLNFP